VLLQLLLLPLLHQRMHSSNSGSFFLKFISSIYLLSLKRSFPARMLGSGSGCWDPVIGQFALSRSDRGAVCTVSATERCAAFVR